MSRTYPDQAQVYTVGHGSGFSNMGGIIHDFMRYNKRVQHDFSSLLNAGLTVAQRQLIDRVAEESDLRRLPLYAVGGLPRDLWLGSKATDLDLVVEGDAIELARVLASRYGGKVTAHARFGTAKWDLKGTGFEAGIEDSTPAAPDHGGHFLDLVSARSETYRHPAALPTVKRGTIGNDVRRRDFTINTLALRLDGSHFGEVRDEFGAIDDLKSGSVRVLHARSFLDDPTRMYRAVRYEQRFAFKIADDTLALMPEARPLVSHLSGQRIRHELDLILEEAEASSMLARLARLDLLGPVHTSLPHSKSALGRVRMARQAPAIAIPSWSRRNAAWLLWLMDLNETKIRSLGKRLHFTSPALRDLSAAARLYGSVSSLARRRPSKCAAYLDGYPEIALYTVSLAATGRTKRVLNEYLAKWKRVRPTITGHDLKGLGLPPGPAYRKILGDLRAAWIDGLVNDPDEERLRLHDLLRKDLHVPHKTRSRRSARKGLTRAS